MCPLNDYCSCHEDDEAERQSDTACCPRETIPDSCSCPEGCECMCRDCDCDSEECSWCGGEWYLQECDDPIQCCDPGCDGQWHPCVACQGTGLAKHQVIW